MSKSIKMWIEIIDIIFRVDNNVFLFKFGEDGVDVVE